MENRGCAMLHRLASRGVTFVRRAARIRGHERDTRGIDGKLLGGNLDERSLDSLSKLDFSGEHRDAAVGVDAYARVEQRRVLEAAGQLCAARRFSRRLSALAGCELQERKAQDRK